MIMLADGLGRSRARNTSPNNNVVVFHKHCAHSYARATAFAPLCRDGYNEYSIT